MDRLPEAVRYYRALTPIVATAVAGIAAGLVTDSVSPSPRRYAAWFRAWCRAACRHLGLHMRLLGVPSDVPSVYISNHRSYLDILLLGGVLDASFLSRDDVADWPLIGVAARGLGTVFIDRDDPRSGARAARALIRCLRARSVVVFPEGTTGGEHLPPPFADGLFRLLERLEAPVVPVTIRYSDRSAYWTALDIGAHLRTRVLPRTPLDVAVHLGAPLRAASFADPGAFAAATYRAVCEPIETLGELVT
jgi:1-acyl-sn-glycerol-3-phosphate acyltransferase